MSVGSTYMLGRKSKGNQNAAKIAVAEGLSHHTFQYQYLSDEGEREEIFGLGSAPTSSNARRYPASLALAHLEQTNNGA